MTTSDRPGRSDAPWGTWTGTEPRSRSWLAETTARDWVALAAFAVVCQAAGLIGIPFTDRATGGWYDQLDKPPFNPPSAVFGPVWTTLYLLMAVAAWLVWRSGHVRRQAALGLFALQLVLNAAWTPVFFGARSPGWGLVVIVGLWSLLAVMAPRFFAIDRVAGALIVPYLAWVAFALVLNAAIVALN